MSTKTPAVEINFLVNWKRKLATYLPMDSDGLYQLKINDTNISLPIEALMLLNFRAFTGVVSSIYPEASSKGQCLDFTVLAKKSDAA